MDSKIYSVYCIENIVNGRKYIGSSGRVNERLGQHFIDLRGGYHHNVHLAEEFKMYGQENFKTSILCTCLESDRLETEGRLINKLASFDLVGGYNLDYYDEQTGKFLRAKSSNDRLSETQSLRFSNPWEHKNSILIQPTSRPLIYINLVTLTSAYYSSQGECSRVLGLKTASLTRTVNNFPYVTKSKNGVVFGCIDYKEFKEVYNSNLEYVIELLQKKYKESLPKPKEAKTKIDRRIIKYDLNYNFLAIFNTLGEADKDLGLSRSNIHQVASYQRNQTNGFIYRYADKIKDEMYKNKNLPKRKKPGVVGSKKVINPSTGEIWASAYEASLYNNVGYSALKMQMRGSNRNILGFMYLEDYNKQIKL